MSRGSQNFKQSDLTRALKGAKAAGVEIARVKIAKDGSIEIDIGNAQERENRQLEGSNEWDAALK